VSRPAGRARGGFTLAELVVAVGILALMMALAGEMFSIAVRSTGQATALTNVSQRLRMVEQTLREDLAHVSRDSSLLVIMGNPTRNYWTQAGYEADDADKDPSDGYPHVADPEREEVVNGRLRMVPPRADILMFVTQRRGVRSAVFTDVTSNAQQVVYGHALQTEYRFDATAESGYRSEIDPNDVVPKNRFQFRGEEEMRQFPLIERHEPSPVPASQWHLARRSVLLTNDAPPQQPDPDGRVWADTQLFDAAPGPDGDWPLLAGLTDVVGLFDYNGVLLPGIPAPFHGESSQTWNRLVKGGKATDYLVRGKWARRSVLDLTPPAPIGDRIASYFLPNCASFKVEWTVDPALYESDPENVPGRGAGDRVLWFDSDYTIDASRVYQTMKRELDRLEEVKGQAEPIEAQRYQRRVYQIERLRTIFADHSRLRFPPDNNGNYDDIPGLFWYPRLVKLAGSEPAVDVNGDPLTVPDAVYPYALRITIDVFDENLRLDRPVRHVMVIPVGA